jgi:hypothetical protein
LFSVVAADGFDVEKEGLTITREYTCAPPLTARGSNPDSTAAVGWLSLPAAIPASSTAIQLPSELVVDGGSQWIPQRKEKVCKGYWNS